MLGRFAERVLPRLRELPAQAIHNDANEHNVLVGGDGRVSGLIDFGDLCRAPRVCGLAVACAYAMTALAVPEREVLPLVAGYHELAPLHPEELALLGDLIRTRLAVSIAMAALQRAEQPDNEYLLISQQGVSALLERLGAVPPELELLRLRDACGYEAVPTARAVRAHLRLAGAGPICGAALADAPLIDFSGEDPAAAGGRAGARALPRGPPGLRLRGVRGRAARRAAHAAPRRRRLPAGRRADPGAARRDGPRRRVPPAGAGLGRDRRARPRDRRRRPLPHALRPPLAGECRAPAGGRRAAARGGGRPARRRVRERRLGAASAPADPHHGPRPRQPTRTASARSPSATCGSRSAPTRTCCWACRAASAPIRRAPASSCSRPAGRRSRRCSACPTRSR